MATEPEVRSEPEARPWQGLRQLLGDGAAPPEPARIARYLDALPEGQLTHTFAHLSEEECVRVLAAMEPDDAADVLEQLPEVQAVELIEALGPERAASILRHLPSDHSADLLGELEPDEAEAILAGMHPAEAMVARTLIQYEDSEAGGLMVTEFLTYPDHFTVGEVIEHLRLNAERFRDIEVQYLYVTDRQGRLTGVLPMRDLVLGGPEQPIGELMVRQPLTMDARAPLADLRDFFVRHRFLGVPVVDPAGRLIGVVQRGAVEEAASDRSESDYRRSQGIVSEEIRTMPVPLRARRRLSWLSVNIGLNIISASVIGLYLDTLNAVIALAVFLPIISDMSGCSGNQAVAVSIRELTLGIIRPADAFRVWLREIAVGIIIGIALGLLLGVVAWLWQANAWLGVVVGAALMLNTLVAVTIGGLVPLALKRAAMDPALASGPILTTITDMVGFGLVLGFAAALLPYLT